MSDYKNIEGKLAAVSGTVLERIVCRIICGEYNNPLNLVHHGESTGKDKSRQGTPDISFQLSNGNSVLVEVSSQTSGIDTKIRGDLGKCAKKADKLRVEKVIYACLAKPDLAQLNEYRELCAKFCSNTEIPFELWGIDKLTEFLHGKYKEIARDELGVVCSYGSFLTIAEWEKSEHDVSQTHAFLYRDDEIKKIKELLQGEAIVLLYGKAGCGKTRLAVKVAQELGSSQGYKTFIVKGALEKAIDDLNTENNGRKLLFILDDVNRMPYLNEFVAYSRKYKNIKVIATVRDYALDGIKSNLIASGLISNVSFLEVASLSREQQEAIVRKILPSVKHGELSTIRNVCAGNMRFAVMCADIAKGGGTLPKDLAEIVKEHFARVEADLKDRPQDALDKDTKNKYQEILAILAVANRIVDIEPMYNSHGRKVLDEILEQMNFTRAEFFDAMAYWNSKELVNISFDNRVFEIADQILAIYLFYKTVFSEEKVSLRKIFEVLFPAYRNRVVEVFQAMLPIYGYWGTKIETELKKLWKEKYINDAASAGFIEAFHPLLQAETLSFIDGQVKAGAGIPWLPVLCRFEASNKSTTAIDMIVKVLLMAGSLDAKNQKDVVEGLSLSVESFNFNLAAQIYFIEKLEENFNNKLFKDLFIDYAKELLAFANL